MKPNSKQELKIELMPNNKCLIKIKKKIFKIKKKNYKR